MFKGHKLTGCHIKHVRVPHYMHTYIRYRKRHAIFYGGDVITGNMASIYHYYTAGSYCLDAISFLNNDCRILIKTNTDSSRLSSYCLYESSKSSPCIKMRINNYILK